MAQNEQLSLSWDAHQKNICSGLSLLQQRGEFVDMTLAADGHHVKVHQMVLSLVSPYIKDLISTAQCPHPVIFLNNISYSTLCAILEYVYTGEVLVPKHRLDDLIAAGKALHIKGLREMVDQQPLDPPTASDSSLQKPTNISEMLKAHREKKSAQTPEKNALQPIYKVYLDEETGTEQDVTMETQDDSTEAFESATDIDTKELLNTPDPSNKKDIAVKPTPEATRNTIMSKNLQYSISNQGGLQAIHNRYIYNLRYFGKKDRKRTWRCVDYSRGHKCPAVICSDENNQVTDRSFTHNHPFHDNKILKKVRNSLIYSVYQEAAIQADCKKGERRVPCNVKPENKSEAE